MTTTVFLVRHGETHYNVLGRIQGAVDSRLTFTGKKQAKALRKFFAKKKINAAICSPLQRSKQTAKIAFPERKLMIEPLLSERRFGVWEGKTRAMLEKEFPEEFRRFQKTRIVTVKGAETLSHAKKRAQKLLQKIITQYAGKMIVLVGHGGFNKAILQQALHWTNSFMAQQHQLHGNVSELEFDGKKWHLKRHGHTRHLKLTKNERVKKSFEATWIHPIKKPKNYT